MSDSADTAPEPSGQREQADPAEPTTSVPPLRDIASHRPGHALAAKILTLLTEAGIRAPVAAAMLPPEVRGLLQPWAVGFVGEERVGVELAWLDTRWRVLHSVPVGSSGADVDHILIGPAGVFTVNSKHHPGGRVDVRGDAVFLGSAFKHYVADARSEARHVRDRLSARGVDAEVRPLVCVVGAHRLRVIEAPGGVKVLGSADLVGHLNSLPPALTRSAADAAFEAARQPDTWPGAPASPAPDWVVELTRTLGAPVATKAVSKSRAQSGTSHRALRSGARTRSPVRPTRPGRSRSPSAARRTLLNVAALLAVVFLVPPVLTGVMKGIVAGAQRAIPTPSASPDDRYLAPDDLDVGYAGGACPSAAAQARHPIGNRLLLCRKNDAGKRVWVHADPWLRLPVQSESVVCTVQGAHARSFFGDRRTLICAADGGSLKWEFDPTWQP